MPSPASAQRTSGYNPSRDRRRIQWTILALAVVLIAMAEARKPENWRWMAPLAPGSDGGKPVTNPTVPGLGKDQLAPDEVRLIPAAEVLVPRADNPRWPREPGLRVPPELLASVVDSKVGVRSDERPALLAMLDLARSAGNRRLSTAARASLPFATLINDPAEHRGEVATVEGELRRYLPIPAGANELGLETLYEGWMFTDEAGRTNPYRIVCATRTPDLPQGSEIRERVRIPAYFFKRMIYATAHGQHSAPMFVGDQFEILPKSSQGLTDPGRNVSQFLTPAMVVVGALLAGLTYLTTQRFHRGSQRNPVKDDKDRLQFGTHRSVSEPATVDSVDPREFLRDLAQRDVDEAPQI